MAVEIKELIIRTEIRTRQDDPISKVQKEDLELLKKRLLEECRKMINASSKRKIYHR